VPRGENTFCYCNVLLRPVCATIGSLPLFFAVTGTSRILKELFSNSSEDNSDLGIVNKMAITELLNSGQSMNAILDCLKVCFAELVQRV